MNKTKPTTEWNNKPLYKVLTNGQSQNGGSMKWNLPTKSKPSKWHKCEGKVKVCSNGLHVTTEPYKWVGIDSTLYLAEIKGDYDTDGGDKVAAEYCRLVKEVPHEQWWLDAVEFIKTIKDVPFFQNNGKLPRSKKIKVFDSRDAARGAAWDAARGAAWGAAWGAARDAARDAARGAAWDAARGAAWDAAWDAARDAAWDAAWGAARDAARGAAWDAALYTTAIHIGTGLNIPKKHLDYAKLVWSIWTAGYGVLCDVDGIIYVYKGKP